MILNFIFKVDFIVVPYIAMKRKNDSYKTIFLFTKKANWIPLKIFACCFFSNFRIENGTIRYIANKTTKIDIGIAYWYRNVQNISIFIIQLKIRRELNIQFEMEFLKCVVRYTEYHSVCWIEYNQPTDDKYSLPFSLSFSFSISLYLNWEWIITLERSFFLKLHCEKGKRNKSCKQYTNTKTASANKNEKILF